MVKKLVVMSALLLVLGGEVVMAEQPAAFVEPASVAANASGNPAAQPRRRHYRRTHRRHRRRGRRGRR